MRKCPPLPPPLFLSFSFSLFLSCSRSRSIARARERSFSRTHTCFLSRSLAPLSPTPSLLPSPLPLSFSLPPLSHVVQGCPCVSRGGREDGRGSQVEEKEEEETGGPGGQNTRPRRVSGSETERWWGIDEWKGVQSSSWGYHRQVTVEMATNVVAG